MHATRARLRAKLEARLGKEFADEQEEKLEHVLSMQGEAKLRATLEARFGKDVLDARDRILEQGGTVEKDIHMHVNELKASIDWTNPVWRRGFLAFMSISVFPVLQGLDEEGRAPSIPMKEMSKIGLEIKRVLELVELDFGRKGMTWVLLWVSKYMGHTLSPLHGDILDKLKAENVEILGVDRMP